MRSAKTTAPMTPPIPEAPRLAPRARPACPFFAMGNPSTIVAASAPVPGTPNKDAWDLSAGVDHGVHGKQKHRTRHHVHVENEGDQ